jgi:hypothetical protein
MIRNFKVLGLALVAILAMSAVVASAASAQLGKLTSSNGGAMTLIGSEYGGAETNRFTAFGSNVECDSVYTGHQVGSTTTLLPNGSSEVTVTPHYTNCGTNHVLMNGCDFKLYDATTVGGVGHTYSVTADLVCPAGKDVVIDRTAFPSGCDTTLKPQTGLKGAHLTTTTGALPGGLDDVDLHGTVTGITAENACFGTTNAAQLHLGVTIDARDALGTTRGVRVSD